ncbi:hypothetical protein [Pseudobutyrivibrio sp.]
MEELIIRVVELQGSPFAIGLKQSEEIKSTQLATSINGLHGIDKG